MRQQEWQALTGRVAGDSVAGLGASEVVALDNKIHDLGADVAANALNPALAGFATGAWAPLMLNWQAWRFAHADAATLQTEDARVGFAGFVRDYNAALETWLAMGQVTSATRAGMLDSWPRRALDGVIDTVGKAGAAAGGLAALATLWLVYDSVRKKR